MEEIGMINEDNAMFCRQTVDTFAMCRIRLKLVRAGLRHWTSDFGTHEKTHYLSSIDCGVRQLRDPQEQYVIPDR